MPTTAPSLSLKAGHEAEARLEPQREEAATEGAFAWWSKGQRQPLTWKPCASGSVPRQMDRAGRRWAEDSPTNGLASLAAGRKVNQGRR